MKTLDVMDAVLLRSVFRCKYLFPQLLAVLRQSSAVSPLQKLPMATEHPLTQDQLVSNV